MPFTETNESWDIGDASYTSNSGDVSSEMNQVEDVRYNDDGSKMYVSGYDTSDDGAIAEYTLSTNHDPSSLSNESVTTVGGTLKTSGFDFSSSGSILWTIEQDDLEEHSLSTNYDISTFSTDNTETLSEFGDTRGGVGVYVGKSGEKLFIVTEETTPTLYEYDMSSANDSTSLSYSGNSYALSEVGGIPEGVYFKDDGSKFYVTDPDNDRLLQYSTDTDWTLSPSPSFDNKTLDVSGEDASARGPAFGADGDNILVGGESNDSVYQYKVKTTINDISTSYETFPDVPHIIDRSRRSGQVTSEANNEFQDFRQLNHRPFYAYTLDMSVLSPNDHDKIQDLSITHSGYDGSSGNVRFLFKDPDDNSVSGVSFGTGDGSTEKFQLKNKYTFGGQSIKYVQRHIDEGTVTIKDAGSTVDDDQVGVNYDSGAVKFTDPPADGNDLTATFDFFRLCQFRNPEVSVSIETAARRNQTIEIVEVPGA